MRIDRLTFIFLLFILLLSLILNYFFYHQAIHYYYKLNAVRLDPLGLEKHIEIPDKNSTVTTVSIWGDSRASRWKTPQIPQYRFFNQGIGSQTSEQVLRRFQLETKLIKPDIIILQTGINDLKSIALFPANKEKIIKKCKRNIQTFINLANKQGIFVIITTLFPLGNVPLYRKPFWSTDIPQAVNEINCFIRSLNNKSVLVFDTYTLLTQNTNHLNYTKDLLHLNIKGYHLLNYHLRDILLKLKANKE